MTEQEIYDLYVAQSENVRELWKVKESLMEDIDYYIRKNDSYQIKIKTKFLSLLYSAWSEAQFIQIVFTPKGFSYPEIKQILSRKERHGISQAWSFMLNKAMQKTANTSNIPNILANLKGVVTKHIAEPSELRNKIAHGQWINAINSKMTLVNPILTQKLSSLDPVKIDTNFEIHQCLGFIVRDLIQSPTGSFPRDYPKHVNDLNNFLTQRASWDINSKKSKLNNKPIPVRIQIYPDVANWMDLNQKDYKFVNQLLRDHINNDELPR